MVGSVQVHNGSWRSELRIEGGLVQTSLQTRWHHCGASVRVRQPGWATFVSPPTQPLSPQNMVNIMNYQCRRRRGRLPLWNGPIQRCCFVTRGAINGPNGCANTAGRGRSQAPCSADGRRHCEPDHSLWCRVANEARQNTFPFISCSVSRPQPVPPVAG